MQKNKAFPKIFRQILPSKHNLCSLWGLVRENGIPRKYSAPYSEKRTRSATYSKDTVVRTMVVNTGFMR